MTELITIAVIVVVGVLCTLLPDNDHHDKYNDEDDLDPRGIE
jgi:hypothetical protein